MGGADAAVPLPFACGARRSVEVGVDPFELVGVAAAANDDDGDGYRPLDITTWSRFIDCTPLRASRADNTFCSAWWIATGMCCTSG